MISKIVFYLNKKRVFPRKTIIKIKEEIRKISKKKRITNRKLMIIRLLNRPQVKAAKENKYFKSKSPMSIMIHPNMKMLIWIMRTKLIVMTAQILHNRLTA